MSAFIAIIVCYFLGSVPFGYLIAKRFEGIDIREHGSGNPGATNVYRIIGKKAGLATLALDILKGFLPLVLVRLLFPREAGTAVLCGLAAIAGHNWSPFLNFKGGKGVATSAGVFLAILPLPTLVALGVFALAAGWSKHVSLGSVAAATALLLVTFALSHVTIYKFAALVVGIAIVVKHIPNIKRLLRGEEPTFQWRGANDEKKY